MHCMKALTIRNVDKALAQALERERRQRGHSMNETVLQLLRRALGVQEGQPRNGLAKLAATWSESDFETFQQNTEVFERIDTELWS